MTMKTITEHVRELLPVGYRKMNGAILYSASDTLLGGGKFYLMGTNPGGDPDAAVQKENTIDAAIDAMMTQKANSYLDENWIDESSDKDKEGNALVQQRIQKLASEILYEDLRKICATNLLFGRSRRSNTDYLATDSFWTHVDLCWPVHLFFISLIDPKVLIVFGNGTESPYAYIQWKYDVSSDLEDHLPSGYSNWQIKRLRDVPIWGKKRTLIGVPHFSYFNPKNKDALPVLKKWVEEA
jgi:hypothetical protein